MTTSLTSATTSELVTDNEPDESDDLGLSTLTTECCDYSNASLLGWLADTAARVRDQKNIWFTILQVKHMICRFRLTDAAVVEDAVVAPTMALLHEYAKAADRMMVGGIWRDRVCDLPMLHSMPVMWMQLSAEQFGRMYRLCIVPLPQLSLYQSSDDKYRRDVAPSTATAFVTAAASSSTENNGSGVVACSLPVLPAIFDVTFAGYDRMHLRYTHSLSATHVLIDRLIYHMTTSRDLVRNMVDELVHVGHVAPVFPLTVIFSRQEAHRLIALIRGRNDRLSRPFEYLDVAVAFALGVRGDLNECSLHSDILYNHLERIIYRSAALYYCFVEGRAKTLGAVSARRQCAVARVLEGPLALDKPATGNISPEWFSTELGLRVTERTTLEARFAVERFLREVRELFVQEVLPLLR